MSMLHHAYLFDHRRFEAELLPALSRALDTGGSDELRGWVHLHRAELTDPYEGEPLTDTWEEKVELSDPHQYGDFALTRYYRVRDDRGLGDQWRFVAEVLQHVVGNEAMMLGAPVGPRTNVFNPGKRGSYFQPPAEVSRHLLLLKSAIRKFPSAAEPLEQLQALLQAAVAARQGLYITF